MAKTVLIVDDNAFIRQALCEIFKREADFEVCGEAENGKEAIEKTQGLRPDLIVLDLSMPVMNGLDAARVLKRLMRTVPLIMYSAFGHEYAEQQARSMGISELVSKSEHASALFTKPAVSSIPLPLEAILFSSQENLASPAGERGGLPEHPQWPAAQLYGLGCRSFVPTLADG